MAGRGSIISGAKHIPGGARSTAAPQGGAGGANFGQVSPLARQLDTGGPQGGDWTRTYGGFLPRPTQDFTEGAFGPFSPILPVPVDAPPPGGERAEPRREEYRVGWNLPVGTPGTEGIKLADFSTLRTLADLYSVARACIQLRKAEVRGLEWDIMPTHDAAKKMRNDHKAMRDFGERRTKAIKFFKHPDPDYFSWNSWLDALLEEVFVFDALSILIRPKWGKGMGKGLLGSDLDSLALINGPTIRPLYDINGSYPRPPAPAYQQYLYGVPRVDLMSMITHRDIEESGLSGSELKQFRGDQLLYLPMTPRRWTPYGFPPIERALIPVMSGLQKQGYQLDFFREGSIPGLFVSPGGTNANMTPNQIRELQDALNAIAGDPAWKHKIIVLPADSKVMPQKPVEIADQFDEIVMNQVCVVPGTEIITKRGLVKIEDIEIGDEVITHKGRWRPVLAKFKNERGHRPVRKISARGFDEIEATDNHKFWTARKGQTVSHKGFIREFTGVSAGELLNKRSRGDFDSLTLPVVECGADDAVLEVGKWLSREYDGRSKNLPSFVPMDRSLGLLLGYYMAEGCLGRSELVFSFHKDETDYHEAVVKAAMESFGLHATVYQKPGTNVAYVKVYSVQLADLFSCGTAIDKVLPEWAWEGSREFFQGLLEGWVNGDGCVTNNGFKGYTASKSLAWQMRLVAAICGHAAGIRTQKQPEISFGGRKLGGQGFIYAIQWVSNPQKPNSYKLEDGYLTSAIQSNNVSDYTDQVVWNLNVQEDHTYTTTGGTVFNCMAFDVQPMELGIMPKVSTTVSPGAAHQMSKATQDIQSRKATKPLLMFLADIMNGVLHNIAHQDDMRFVFEGANEEEDEEIKTNRLVMQIGAGLRSIDEGREELNLQPWGLPETSDPGWATPNGWIPLVEATEARQTGYIEGNVLELPAGQPRATSQLPSVAGAGGSGAVPMPPKAGPAAASANGAKPRVNAAMSGRPGAMASGRGTANPSPGHTAATSASGKAPANSKTPAKPAARTAKAEDSGKLRAVESELSALARHVRKGRLISSWEARHVDQGTLARISEHVARGLDIEDAITVIKTTRRVDLDGQVVWTPEIDPSQVPMHNVSAAGGGGRVFPAHDVTDTEINAGRNSYTPEVPGGTPGISAGNEPPRWAPPEGTSTGQTFSEPRSRTVTPPQDEDDAEAPSHRGRPVHQGGGPLGPQQDTWPRAIGGPGGGRNQAGTDSPPGAIKADVAAQVRELLSRNFPDDAISWVMDVEWTGPKPVKLSNIDFDDESSWAAHHQASKVDAFVAQIKAGNPPNPAVMVKTDSQDELHVVDGHHRTMAYQKLNLPVPAYIGFVSNDDDRWMETHSSQRHQGSDPANKMAEGMVSKESVNYRPAESMDRRCGNCSMFREPSGCTLVAGIIRRDDVCDEWDPIPTEQTVPVAAGIAVLAMDTGRILMLQRAMTDDDPAAGTWEFPGGCLEPGETPMIAAEREWQEETGCVLPRGRVIGTWSSENGVYQGFVYLVGSEDDVDLSDGRGQVINPDDPDGDEFEALAWWNPDHLADCPALRPELAMDLDNILELVNRQ